LQSSGGAGGCGSATAGNVTGCGDDEAEVDDDDYVVGSVTLREDDLMSYCKSGGKISV
jgi:hypothetical protein